MIPLTELLSRFKNITNTDKSKKELVGRLINEVIGITIDHKKIIFSKDIIFLKINPVIKTEILLNKQAVIKKIKTKKELSYFSDIK